MLLRKACPGAIDELRNVVRWHRQERLRQATGGPEGLMAPARTAGVPD